MNANVLRKDFSNTKLALTALAVLVASIPLSYLAWEYDIRPALNIVWMIGIPGIAAVLSKSSVGDRIMAAVLFAVSLFFGIGVTAAFIGYP